jgi:hypothetical protein
MVKLLKPEKSIGVRLTEGHHLEPGAKHKRNSGTSPAGKVFCGLRLVSRGDNLPLKGEFSHEIDDGQGRSQSHRGALASQSIL